MKRSSFRPNPNDYPSNLVEIFGAIDACNEEVAIDYIQQYLGAAQKKTKNAMDESLLKTAIKNITHGDFGSAKQNLMEFDDLLCSTINSGGFFTN
jgi:uncharacterized glyoxalase superfamily protein PhnB